MFQAEGQSGARRVRWTTHSSPDEAQGIRCGWRRGRDAEGVRVGEYDSWWWGIFLSVQIEWLVSEGREIRKKLRGLRPGK